MADEAMATWCRRWLGTEPVEVLFRSGDLSEVTERAVLAGLAV